MYIGSANSDWRSLTQVKEMGVYIQDCPCVAEDLGKIFDVSIYNITWSKYSKSFLASCKIEV